VTMADSTRVVKRRDIVAEEASFLGSSVGNQGLLWGE